MSSRSSHIERTATEPRKIQVHPVRLSSISQVNSRIRLLTLTLPYALQFLPGQWLDVHVPGVSRAGGFTITSTPSLAAAEDKSAKGTRATSPYLELAIQKSPSNPPAAWLWQLEEKIKDKELQIRIGGKFVWPPPGVDLSTIENLVLVAGGVGINPLMSILRHLHEQATARSQGHQSEPFPKKLTLLYGSKPDSGYVNRVLFYPRIRNFFESSFNSQWACRLFVSGSQHLHDSSNDISHPNCRVEVLNRRMVDNDVVSSLQATQDHPLTVAYVCGPPNMTDHFVDILRRQDGMSDERVLCEKWW